MTYTRTNRSMLALGLAAGCSLLALQGAAAQTSGSVEEIVVTANKRAENLNSVPSAISVLSATTLKTQNITNFADYTKVIPGFSTAGANSPGHGQAVIRGVTSGVAQQAPTTGVYLDDIPFTTTSPMAAAGGATFDPYLADIERVEVLKGPQSTLYGASAMGGIIKVVTKKPSLTALEGSAMVEGAVTDGGAPSFGVRASINVPVVEGKFAVRAAAYDRRDGGFVDNVYTRDTDTNGSRSIGGRLSARVQVTDRLDTNFSTLWQSIKNGGTSTVYLDMRTLQPLYGDRKISAVINPRSETKYVSAANTTNYDLGFATLTNSLSFVRTTDERAADYTVPYGQFLAGAPADSLATGLFKPNSKRVTDELRIASNPGQPLEWMLGGFFTNERDHYGSYLAGLNPRLERLPLPQGNLYTFDAYPNFREKAAFGNMTYHFTPEFEATAGVRYSENKQYFSVARTGVLGSTLIPPSDSTDNATTYLFTASYHPTPNSTLYARAASAYRPGSTQITANTTVPKIYAADSLWNYEIGYKGSWLDGKLNVDAAAYHIDWSKIQLNSIINGFTVIGNAGNAKIDGAELSLRYYVSSQLSIGGNGAYNYARIRTNNPAIGAVIGDPLPFAPRVTGNLFVDYEMPVGPSATGRIGASYSYQGSRYTSFSGDPLNTRYKLDSFGTVDLHGGIDWGRYSFDLRASNLTNQTGITAISLLRVTAAQVVPAQATISRPRTILATVTASF